MATVTLELTASEAQQVKSAFSGYVGRVGHAGSSPQSEVHYRGQARWAVNDHVILEGLNPIKGQRYITPCYQTKDHVHKLNVECHFMCATKNISEESGNMCRGVMEKLLMEYVACCALRAEKSVFQLLGFRV